MPLVSVEDKTTYQLQWLTYCGNKESRQFYVDTEVIFLDTLISFINLYKKFHIKWDQNYTALR